MTCTIRVLLDLCRQEEDAQAAYRMARMMRISRVCPVSDALQNLIETEFQAAGRKLEQIRERKRVARAAVVRQVLTVFSVISVLAFQGMVWFLKL